MNDPLLSTPELDAILLLAKEFIRSQADNVRNNWQSAYITQTKDSGCDVVTNFDTSVEKAFSDWIYAHFPEFGFQGEDSANLNREGKDGYVWDIDSIDGTKYFSAGIPLWCTTIGLRRGEVSLLGIIYNPVSGQMYSAIRGGGAFLDGERLLLANPKKLSKTQVVLDVSTDLSSPEVIKRIQDLFSSLYTSTYRMRMIGSGALSLAWVAQGFFGLYINPLLRKDKMIDIVGGVLIAEEAGAVTYRYSVDDSVDFLMTGHPELIEEARGVLRI